MLKINPESMNPEFISRNFVFFHFLLNMKIKKLNSGDSKFVICPKQMDNEDYENI